VFIGDEPDTRWVVTTIPSPMGSGTVDAIRHEAQGVSLLCNDKTQAEWLAKTLNDKLIAPLADFDGTEE
jgi:hypothetical protein